MDLLVLAALWAGTLLLVIVTLLFGQNPSLQHTPLPRLHWVLTRGAGAALSRAGGGRGADLLRRAGELCCERSNPAVQILFVAMVAGCYAVFYATVFPMLPLPGLPAWHKYTGSLAAAGTLALFAAASFSDPGAVTASNLAAHQALYPCDGLVFPAGRECWTCGLPRPARSKHCSACGRCVARCDHHCIWLNNCVGLANTRWFLAFLAATAALCAYGACVGYCTLRADMAARGAWDTAFIDGETERLVYLRDSWRFLWRFLSSEYGPQVAVTFFAGAAGWIVAGFSAYQLWLICAGVTTSEIHKRRQVALALELQREAAEVEERAERALAGGRPRGSHGSSADESGAHAQPGQQQQQQQQDGRRRRGKARPPPLPNAYHRGAWRNLAEVLFPHRALAAAEAAAKEA